MAEPYLIIIQWNTSYVNNHYESNAQNLYSITMNQPTHKQPLLLSYENTFILKI